MTPVPYEPAVAAWKRQLDLALQVAEAVVDGAQAAREIQRAADVEAHAWLEAARSSVASASPAEFAALQMRLGTENLAKVAHYWAALATNARDTQVRIFELLVRNSAGTPLLSSAVQSTAPASGHLNELVDAGYRQWLETLRRLYAMPTPVKPA